MHIEILCTLARTDRKRYLDMLCRVIQMHRISHGFDAYWDWTDPHRLITEDAIYVGYNQ